MTFSFNLIDQQWIPCITRDNMLAEVSLYDLLANAHEIREIHCETPVMTAAFYPMLLALLHRIFGPENRAGWRNLWRRGSFSMDEIGQYLEQWYDRFDIFHPDHPFYQRADERGTPKSVLYLAETIGNTSNLFDHRMEQNNYMLTPQVAAITLLTAQAFRLGGGISGKGTRNFVDSIFSRGVLFFAEGDNLFETLVLNMNRYPAEHLIPSGANDMPAWEREHRAFVSGQENAIPDGYLDYLTWQTNNILLIPKEWGQRVVVQQFSIVPVMPVSPDVRSPQKRYSRKEKDNVVSWSFMYFSPTKDLWREFHNLVSIADPGNHPPAIVEWLANVLEDDTHIRLVATGMLADQGKPIFYRQERLPLPLELVRDATKLSVVKEAVKDADEVADVLRHALSVLAETVLRRGGNSKPDPKDCSNMIAQWGSSGLYWAELEPHFWRFVEEIVASPMIDRQQWLDVLRESADYALDKAITMSGSSAPALEGAVRSKKLLHGRLKKL